jgi:hypothetical protein
MKKPKNAADLQEAIHVLELKVASQERDIQETFASVSENLKPLNLIKNGVRSVISGENKEDLFNVILGIGSGFLGRKLLIGKGNGVIGKTLGRAIQWGMAGLVSKNAETIKEKAGSVIDRIFKKHKPQSNHVPAASPELPKVPN